MVNIQMFQKFSAIILIVLITVFLNACASSAKKTVEMPEPPGPTLVTMPLGDPELNGKFLSVKPDEIYNAALGQKVSFDEMIDDLATKKVVFLGESHTSMNIHKSQDRIIRALYKRNPKLIIGMEFFLRDQDDVLKEWSAGKLTEEQLLYKTGWYATGGYNFGYYSPFMTFAKEKNLPVAGINIPRTILRMVSRGGLDKLPEKEKKMVGEVDIKNKEHKQLIMKYFGGAGGMGHGGNNKIMQAMLDKRYSAQCVWDNVFADSILSSVKDFDGIYVVIVGSGHTAYKLGANRRLADKSDIPQATVYPVDIEKKDDSTRVARSIGDYVLGFEEDSEPAHFPNLGVSASEKNGKVVVGMLFPGSASLKAGFKTGDHILTLDGIALKDPTQMRILLSRKKWGDKAVYKVSRGEKEIEIIREAKK